ncbi:MAG: hypothetical protein ACE5I7_04590 [Candidatus Binatia bacterium]
MGEQARVSSARVKALARELAEAINAGEVEGREGLREDAVRLLRDEVQIHEPASVAALPPAPSTFNPFGIGIPLVLMGAVLVLVFPPVGLLMFGGAAVMIAWGVGATLLARR